MKNIYIFKFLFSHTNFYFHPILRYFIQSTPTQQSIHQPNPTQQPALNYQIEDNYF